MTQPKIIRTIFELDDGTKVLFDDQNDVVKIRRGGNGTTDIPNPIQSRGGREHKPCATHVRRLLKFGA